jgi:hypothetical protein
LALLLLLFVLKQTKMKISGRILVAKTRYLVVAMMEEEEKVHCPIYAPKRIGPPKIPISTLAHLRFHKAKWTSPFMANVKCPCGDANRGYLRSHRIPRPTPEMEPVSYILTERDRDAHILAGRDTPWPPPPPFPIKDFVYWFLLEIQYTKGGECAYRPFSSSLEELKRIFKLEPEDRDSTWADSPHVLGVLGVWKPPPSLWIWLPAQVIAVERMGDKDRYDREVAIYPIFTKKEDYPLLSTSPSDGICVQEYRMIRFYEIRAMFLCTHIPPYTGETMV